MEKHPGGDRRARLGRRSGEVRTRAGLAALALIVAAQTGASQSGPGGSFDVDSLDLTSFDPDALDYTKLSSTDAIALVERLQQRGDHADALGVLAWEIAEVEGDPRADQRTLAWLHWHVAQTQRLLRRFEEALASLAESERLLASFVSGLPPGRSRERDWAEIQRCTQLNQRGWIQQDWGALDDALASFESERSEIDRLEENGVDVAGIRADSDKRLAVFAAKIGAPERVEALLRERPEGSADPAGMRPYLLLRLGGACLKRARREGMPRDQARATLEDALLEEALLPIDRVYGELWLADLELDEGRLDEARELWRSAGARLEELRAIDSRPRRTWIGVGARIANTGDADERRALRPALVGETEAFLAEWRALEAREGGYGFLHLDDSLRLFCELTELSLALDGAEAGARVAFEMLNRAHAETTLARRIAAGVPSLEALRAALCPREGDGVLVYLAGPTRSWLFALDRETLRALPVADHYAVERSRRGLVQELLARAGSWSDGAHAAARELARLLLPPEVRPWLEGRTHLAVCGLDLFLGEVPFEALDLGEGRYVGAEWAVVNLLPLAASVELVRRAGQGAPAAPGLRLVAAPVADPVVAAELGLQGFTLAPDDLDLLVRAFPRGSCDVVLGTDAHAGALTGGSRAVLQFLVHGSFDEKRSRGAQLVLSPGGAGDDGRLSRADVEHLFGAEEPPRLVVVTACRAGREARRRGDAGANDLAGAFLGRGAQAVVASSFDLDLALACRMSTELYGALARGADAGEALRGARAVLARDPSFAESAQPFLLRVVGAPASPRLAPWAAADEPALGVRICIGVVVAIAALLLARGFLRRTVGAQGSGGFGP